MKTEAKERTALFFVYGTLKVGYGNDRIVEDLLVKSEKACIHGFRIYHLGGFPGIRKGEGVVFGELQELREPEEALRRLDRLEGYSEHEPKRSFYLREHTTVETQNGKSYEAWVYIFNEAIEDRRKHIEDGEWRPNYPR
jgi:gamma-glutamylcyclotransferase (GGCT)/AIG2-like uncharacterized protein YtfP